MFFCMEKKNGKLAEMISETQAELTLKNLDSVHPVPQLLRKIQRLVNMIVS